MFYIEVEAAACAVRSCEDRVVRQEARVTYFEQAGCDGSVRIARQTLRLLKETLVIYEAHLVMLQQFRQEP